MSTAIADKHTFITAVEWFGGGRRVRYDPNHHHILTAHDDLNDLSTPHLMVFERVVGAPDATGRWITMLPGYPDGTYSYAKVNALLGDVREDEAVGLDIRLLPGGHLTTAEQPDLLAALIHERAQAWPQP